VLELTLDLEGQRRAEIRFSDRTEGDFAGASPGFRRLAMAGSWTRLCQRHGATVVIVGEPGEGDGASADAAVTTASGAILSVRTADCAPVALVASEGVIAAVHAGWRGLAGGVIEAATDSIRSLGGVTIQAFVGPCIHAECYEFGSEPLAGMTDRFGPGVVSRTAWGTPALDIPAAVRTSLERSGVTEIVDVGRCTACEPEHWYSHRARGESQRHVLAIWISPN
jgi:hypothetical protein